MWIFQGADEYLQAARGHGATGYPQGFYGGALPNCRGQSARRRRHFAHGGRLGIQVD